ncbi:MAG: hypothetical protein ACO3IB_12110, partial [Phycisphaerales bacterium]
GQEQADLACRRLQARAMSVAMRWLRAGAPRSMGALIWQWNDVWAGHSWSLVDVAGRRKPAWDAVRRACAPRVLSIEPTGGFEQGRPGALEVVLSDDAAFLGPASFERASARAVVERMDFAGNVRARAAVDLVPFAACGLPAATLRGAIPSEILEGARRGHEMLVATVEGDASVGRAVELLGSDADLVLPPARFERVVGAAARVRAASVIHEFWIEQSWRVAPRAATSGADERDPEAKALEQAARMGKWRTLLPGDEIELPPDAGWWSANAFAAR